MTGEAGGALDLDGFYALHPMFARLKPLWDAGEFGAVHAVSTPYRDKRSHFDGQDLLEAGTVDKSGPPGGWLNRMLADLPGVHQETAYSIGDSGMLLLSGDQPASAWLPQT